MAVSVRLPELGESVVEGTIARWLVKEGDRVAVDQPLVEVTTDKVDAEIPAPAAGVVVALLVAEGETVPVGTELARLEPGEGPAAELDAGAAAPARATQERPAGARGAAEPARATPVARRIAEEAGLDLTELEGSGVSGRITKADVARRGAAPAPARELPAVAAGERQAAAAGERQAAAAGERQAAAAARPQAGAAARTEAAPAAARGEEPPARREARRRPDFGHYALQEGDRVIAMSPLRKLVAEHMVYSKHTSPHVGTVTEIDLGRVVAIRERHKQSFRETHGVPLTFLPFVVHATVRALREHPQLNASVLEDSIVERKDVNIGVAVETEKGLIVPVLRHADRLSLAGLAAVIEDLSARARSKRLSADELKGGSFTVSNPGRHGNLYGFAIINQPQVGILRMGEIVKRPVVRSLDGDDAIVIRPTMHLALSYDHRAVDGAPANAFLHRVRELLEEGDFDL